MTVSQLIRSLLSHDVNAEVMVVEDKDGLHKPLNIGPTFHHFKPANLASSYGQYVVVIGHRG